jgi:branched-chain amino acid aminotransferase
MAHIYKKTYFDDSIKSLPEANLSIASSAVLYGLSVYTVFFVDINEEGKYSAFRLVDHYKRLITSTKIIGIDSIEKEWPLERFTKVIREVLDANNIKESGVFIRVTIHVNELASGIRSKNLKTVLSIFAYEAQPILPQNGARIKTSSWRRNPDYSIPSRAKVNGAYVNSVLARQEALDVGYDDCIFLDVKGYVSELSASNIFIVRDGVLITPDISNDILEGITRKTVIELASTLNFKVVERSINLTELYTADEVFSSGTSAFITPIIEIDARIIGSGKTGEITENINKKYHKLIRGKDKSFVKLLTRLN